MKKSKQYLLSLIFLTAFLVTRFYDLDDQLIWEDNFSWHYRLNYYPWVIENNLKGHPEPGKDLKYAGTLSYHPGVTIMTFSGASTRIWKKVYTKINPQYQQCAYLDYKCPHIQTEMIVAKVPIILLSAVLMAISFYLVQKMFGAVSAATFGAFVLFEPLFVLSSRDLHLDFLQASFLLATSLLILMKTPNYVFPGVVFGLATLTRFVSICLFPFYALMLLFKNGLKSAALFILTAVLTFALIYPPMWVAPISTIDYIISGSLDSTTSHTQTLSLNYFKGFEVYFDQFLEFFSLPYKILLVGSLISLPFIYRRLTKEKQKSLALLVLVALVYLAFVNISDKRFIRYLTFSLVSFTVAFGVVLQFYLTKIIPGNHSKTKFFSYK